MEPGAPRSALTGWRRQGCLGGVVFAAAVLLVFGVLFRLSRGRVRILELGMKSVALVVVLGAFAAVVRVVVKARGRRLTLREVAVALLGIACILVLIWFVAMYG
jgi:hypothetical protein